MCCFKSITSRIGDLFLQHRPVVLLPNFWFGNSLVISAHMHFIHASIIWEQLGIKCFKFQAVPKLYCRNKSPIRDVIDLKQRIVKAIWQLMRPPISVVFQLSTDTEHKFWHFQSKHCFCSVRYKVCVSQVHKQLWD